MRLCLNMIVKNESHIIRETLLNVLPYISYWVISDTGSTDGTQDLIKTFFRVHNIPGHLAEHQWEDFGRNRTLALQEAYKHRKHFDYIWVMDADDLVVGELPLPKDTVVDMYSLTYGQGFTYDRVQIFRSTLKWHYVGVLHEFPRCVSKKNPSKQRLIGDYYVDSRRLGARNQCEDKYLRDIDLLHKGLQKEPDNVRYLFYLAQSYMDAKDHENAIKWYQKRVDAGGWVEEVFYSLYRIATNKQELGHDWEEIEKAYLAAWQCLPARVEPLYEIGKYYRGQENYRKAYGVLKTASKIKFPEHLELFIFRSVYDYQVLDELAYCAYHLERYQESFDLYQELLFKRNGVPDGIRSRLEKARDFSVEHILTDRYPVKEIVKLRQSVNGDNNIVLTIFMKDFNNFCKTVNTFLRCCEDCDKIGKWICVYKSNTDLDKLSKLYPFFQCCDEYISENEKYQVYLTDEWEFFEPRNYITQAIEILETRQQFGQVLFNQNYAENCGDRSVVGGVKKITSNGTRYVEHQYYPEGSSGWKAFQEKHSGQKTHIEWPHFRLHPGVIRLETVKDVGLSPETDEFSLIYSDLGYQTAFLDTISCWKIGSTQGLEDIDTKDDGDWIVVNDLDSFGYDLQRMDSVDVDVLKFAAEQNPDCIGFNTLGFLKSKIVAPQEWISVDYPNFQMYIYKKRWNKK